MLEDYPILKNAPITEALIDIRVKLSSDFDINNLSSIYESIKDQYPEKQERVKSKVKIEPQAEEKVKAPTFIIDGYGYVSSDKKQIMQARLDGFTFSRLHPYIKWEELRVEAYRLWQLYRDITSPESITRVAVRYINNLKIPMPIRDFSDYLTAPPTVPEGLPQGVSSFLTRTVIHEPSFGANAIITQALEQVVTDIASVILDIDVFKLESKGIVEKDVWEIIEKLRHFKNKVFFSSITDDLKEMYK
ncbi:MAG: TIGR04255 family protein [Candidatus Scalindua sp.]|nr:TIGR04255 family protein [Candidatus Scalindua sp.]MCR4343767.1 TIGR04255 family protein [Candidatus Scalindua sp.]